MKKVQLKKINTDEVNALRSEIVVFINRIYQQTIVEDFLLGIMLLDLNVKLLFTLRNKVESGKKQFSFQISSSEAAAIIKCCLQSKSENLYTKNCLEKFKNQIDHQLRSLI